MTNSSTFSTASATNSLKHSERTVWWRGNFMKLGSCMTQITHFNIIFIVIKVCINCIKWDALVVEKDLQSCIPAWTSARGPGHGYKVSWKYNQNSWGWIFKYLIDGDKSWNRPWNTAFKTGPDFIKTTLEYKPHVFQWFLANTCNVIKYISPENTSCGTEPVNTSQVAHRSKKLGYRKLPSSKNGGRIKDWT